MSFSWELQRNGQLSDILKDEYKNHWAVGSRDDEEEKLTPLEEYQKKHPNSANTREAEKWKRFHRLTNQSSKKMKKNS